MKEEAEREKLAAVEEAMNVIKTGRNESDESTIERDGEIKRDDAKIEAKKESLNILT